MQYAFVNGIKTEPFKGGKGICITCPDTVIAKCGSRKVHHWAHKGKKICDSWYESETEWHRNWKNCFPESFREVPFYDKVNDEMHRADIHTSTGVTIEFQNSPISFEEISSRDQFYRKLIWVVNGKKFKDCFEILGNIPDPEDKLIIDYDFYGHKHPYLYSRNEILRGETMFNVIGFSRISALKISEKHFVFDWRYERKSWLETKSFVFFDFGDEFLYMLKHRKQLKNKFSYLKKIMKQEFIEKYSDLNALII
jgi:hypothetical protein